MIGGLAHGGRWVVRRVPALRRWAQTLLRVLLPPSTEFNEIAPLHPVASAQVRPRLNLLVPSVSPEHRFGGINTALQFFDALLQAPGCEGLDARIVVTDDNSALGGGPAAQLAGWPLRRDKAEDAAGRFMAGVGPSRQWPLPVRRHDVFIATSWWTAHVLRDLRAWQQQQFQQPARPWAYLIQDYEPGFYPWGGRYWLAQSTYGGSEPDPQLHAVINSATLQRFLARQGHRFAQADCFDAPLHPALRQAAAREPQVRKERVLLAYGRPGVERNAFALVVQALRHWAAAYPGSAGWQVVSAGEAHEPVELAPGIVLQPLGKLSLEDYTTWLQRAAVGFSLMCSPHPSYPPRDMAAFEVDTVTLPFVDKPMDEHRRFRVAASPAPRDLARTLAEATRAFDAELAQRGGATAGTVPRAIDLQHAWMSDAPPFAAWTPALAQHLLAASS